MKYCLRQGISSKNLLVGGLVTWEMICFPATADSLSLQPQQQLSENLVTTDEALPADIISGQAVSPPVPELSAVQPEFTPAVTSESANSLIADIKAERLQAQTSVSQLSDVQPTDWAYQALQNLIERYGVISGFPDGTFRGRKPLSRYEFAAALNATIQKMETLLADELSDRYLEDDIITLRRLEQEFRPALDELSTRVDNITDRTAQLEANQFSVTSKLQGQIIAAATDGNQANASVISRSRLTLLTSFRQNDLLFTQLEAGNNGGDTISRQHNKQQNLLGTTGLLANGGGFDYAEVESQLRLRRLYYTFSPRNDLAVTVGAKMLPRDFLDRNQYAGDEAVDFSSSFFLNNPLIVQNQINREGGAGAAIAWSPGGGRFTVRSLYIAADADEPNPPNGGLFGDRYQGSMELEYLPSTNLALRLQYTNAKINNTEINAYGLNGEYTFNRTTAAFARIGFGSYEGLNTAIGRDLDINPKTWAVGVTLRNFFIPGTVAGIAIGQPFITDGVGNATQTNFEAFYNLQLSDNISVTPTLTLVQNANNDSDNGTAWQTSLRTVFSF